MWYMHGAGWGWWLLMSVGMIAFWAAVIYLVVWLVRGAPRSEEPPDRESPVELLRRRLAAGEISVEEYQERLDALQRDRKDPRSPLAA